VRLEGHQHQGSSTMNRSLQRKKARRRMMMMRKRK